MWLLLVLQYRGGLETHVPEGVFHSLADARICRSCFYLGAGPELRPLSEVWILHDTSPELYFTETVVAPLKALRGGRVQFGVLNIY